MENKAEELFNIWKSDAWTAIGKGEWKEAFKDIRTVSQKDINGFLRLVREKVDFWPTSDLGKFVSLVLGECYKGRFIELDVGAVEGKIDVGRELDWDGVVYVRGDVNGVVGSMMEKGTVVVEGDVTEDVGYGMEGGMIIVEGNVDWEVGYCMNGGVIYVGGDVNNRVGNGMKGGTIIVEGTVEEGVGWGMKGGEIVVKEDVGGYVGWCTEGGVIVIDGDVRKRDWLAELSGMGFVVNNGFVYTR